MEYKSLYFREEALTKFSNCMSRNKMSDLSKSIPKAPRSAVFLDRDGVINVRRPEVEYVTEVAQFDFLPGALEALALLSELGFALVVVTNQRGIAREMMTEDDLAAVHAYMKAEALKRGVRFDGIYHCPHDTFEQCSCRKPEPGMILEAAEDLEIDLTRSYMVGDSLSDIEAGRRAGVRAVQITDGEECGAEMVFPSLLDFALHLKERT
ncbi:MAG: HAD family hydrolase [Desulfomonile sp.]|nr:HAD family hydrolase [Desulfomonile sp.]